MRDNHTGKSGRGGTAQRTWQKENAIATLKQWGRHFFWPFFEPKSRGGSFLHDRRRGVPNSAGNHCRVVRRGKTLPGNRKPADSSLVRFG